MFGDAQPQEGLAIAALEAAAFADDPFFAVHVPDPVRRQRFLRALFLTGTRTATGGCRYLVGRLESEGGGVPQVVSTALLVPPDRAEQTWREFLRCGGLAVVRAAGVRSVRGFFAMCDEAGRPRREQWPHAWFLESFAVDRRRRGQGIGSRMLQEAVLPTVAASGARALALNTNTEANRRFYARNGFLEYDVSQIGPRGRGVPNYSFVRGL